jgi:predicted nucleic acid-binding protein
LSLVVDASVGLKWAIPEEDSDPAEALAKGRETLLLPDFWLNEATNVLWTCVRRGRLTSNEAAERLHLLRSAGPLTPTMQLDLHEQAPAISFAVGCSPYDALYAAFALAMGADHVIAADRPFLAALRRHPDPAVARLPLGLDEWASRRGATSPGGA